MKELVSKDLIVKVGDYNASNPIYKGSKAKSKADKEEATK